MLNSNGVAEWVVFINDNGLESDGPNYGNNGRYRATVDRFNLRVTVTYTGEYDEDLALRAAVEALEEAGYELAGWSTSAEGYVTALVTNANGGTTSFVIVAAERD